MDYKSFFILNDGIRNLNKVYFSFFDTSNPEVTTHPSDIVWLEKYTGKSEFKYTYSGKYLSKYAEIFDNVTIEDDLDLLPESAKALLSKISGKMYYSGNIKNIELSKVYNFKGIDEARVFDIDIDKKVYSILKNIKVPMNRLVIYYNQNIQYTKYLSKILEKHLFESVEFHNNINSPEMDRDTLYSIHNEAVFLQGSNLFIDYYHSYMGSSAEKPSKQDIFIDILKAKIAAYSEYTDKYSKDVVKDIIIREDYTFIPIEMLKGVSIPLAILKKYKVTDLGIIIEGKKNIVPIVQWRSLCIE